MNLCLPRIIVLSAAVFSSATFAANDKELPKDQVPQAVLEAFQKAYPAAKGAKYSQETEDGKTRYEVEFTNKGNEVEATYEADGSLYETEMKILNSELPEKFVNAIKKAHPDATIKEVEMIIGPDEKLSGFEVEIKVGNKEFELHLDSGANIVKTEEEND